MTRANIINTLCAIGVILFLVFIIVGSIAMYRERDNREYLLKCSSGGVAVYSGRVKSYRPSLDGYLFIDVETGQQQSFTDSVVCVSTRVK